MAYASRLPSMPGVERLSVDRAVAAAERAAELGIPAIALFPYTDPALRDDAGSEALNPDNLVCAASRAIKAAVPEIGIVTDVALDPYTSHGHDGLMVGEEIVNDATVEQLCVQALIQAEAGADIIAPSDMMDGRVGAIRRALDAKGFEQRPDHGLHGQIRLGLLRAVPRCDRHLEDAGRRQAHLPDGSRPTATRRSARPNSTSPRAPTC